MESTFRPILHVEDDETEVFLVNRALGVAGVAHPVQVVHDGARAIDYLRGAPPFSSRRDYPLPCLILLDLNMPRMDGLGVLRWRQTQPLLRRIPVIMFTSSQHSSDVVAAYEAGVNGYLVKPVGFEALVELAKGIRTFWLAHNQYATIPDETDQSIIHVLPDFAPVGADAGRSSANALNAEHLAS